MAIRKPRGYTVNRPPFIELCEGVRPNVQALVLEAWTGLPPVRIDDHHDDPIVLDAGTIVGVATGSHGSTSIEGTLMPAVWFSGTSANTWTLQFASTDNTWGLPTADQSDLNIGSVKPIGVVFQPIYSFYLQQHFTNYKRNESVGVVTDYVIQVPAKTANEHAIRAGDVVMVSPVETVAHYGRDADVTLGALAGRFARKESIVAPLSAANAAIAEEYVVGRCLKSFEYATTTSADGTKYQDDTASTVTSAATSEFVGLDKVQTVPGMALAGSGTGGLPGHLLGGLASSSSYRALTILVRL